MTNVRFSLNVLYVEGESCLQTQLLLGKRPSPCPSDKSRYVFYIKWIFGAPESTELSLLRTVDSIKPLNGQLSSQTIE